MINWVKTSRGPVGMGLGPARHGKISGFAVRGRLGQGWGRMASVPGTRQLLCFQSVMFRS